ncbi:MAG: hypothetical protein Q4D26_05715 [Clostridia bacterium]|nr:hypothetical protein [Clostridia bacterium]
MKKTGEPSPCLTWQKVQSYTWESVSQSVSGMILGGLDDDFD